MKKTNAQKLQDLNSIGDITSTPIEDSELRNYILTVKPDPVLRRSLGFDTMAKVKCENMNEAIEAFHDILNGHFVEPEPSRVNKLRVNKSTGKS